MIHCAGGGRGNFGCWELSPKTLGSGRYLVLKSSSVHRQTTEPGLGQPARKDKSRVEGKKAEEKTGVGLLPHRLLSQSSQNPDASQHNGQNVKMLENGLGFHYPCLFSLTCPFCFTSPPPSLSILGSGPPPLTCSEGPHYTLNIEAYSPL